MIVSTLASLLTALTLATSPARDVADTLDVRTLAAAPRVDGHVDDAEYGAPTLHLRTAEGEAKLWLVRSGGWLHIAAVLPDSTWTVELRIRETTLNAGPTLPRIAFRTYNDRPHGWWSFPAPVADAPAHGVERSPQAWMPFRLR